MNGSKEGTFLLQNQVPTLSDQLTAKLDHIQSRSQLKRSENELSQHCLWNPACRKSYFIINQNFPIRSDGPYRGRVQCWPARCAAWQLLGHRLWPLLSRSPSQGTLPSPAAQQVDPFAHFHVSPVEMAGQIGVTAIPLSLTKSTTLGKYGGRDSTRTSDPHNVKRRRPV